MKYLVFAAFLPCFLLLTPACGTTSTDSSPTDTTSDVSSDSSAPLPCTPTDTVCDGNDIKACVDGFEKRTPCGVDAYCNYAKCVPTSIHFPQDAGPHHERSEWWYYTGHIDSGAHHWGFEVTIFRYDMLVLTGSPDVGYMCHVAVVDKDVKEHYHTDTITFEPTIWQNAPVVLDVDNCRFELGGDGRDHIIARIPQGKEKDHKADPWLFDLTTEPKKRPAIHGGDGIIPMSANAGASWYYSYTRLATKGTLSTPAGDFPVTGQAWMDHQYGGFDIVDFKGWDWWSLQFDDGWEIMLFQFTDWNGKLASQAGTVIDPAGNFTELDGLESFQVKSLRKWPSPHTDGIYPLDWDITIPNMDWKFGVKTSVDDQEMYNPAQNYWEGETTLKGTRGTTPLTGVGYTELTGYATDIMDPVKKP